MPKPKKERSMKSKPKQKKQRMGSKRRIGGTTDDIFKHLQPINTNISQTLISEDSQLLNAHMRDLYDDTKHTNNTRPRKTMKVYNRPQKYLKNNYVPHTRKDKYTQRYHTKHTSIKRE
tara:strand:- start:531 stop:884 length:354 start_codon:yes stop_codon:yes gene_type:complete